MRAIGKLILSTLLLSFIALPLSAQTTQVTGTVTDPNGLPYSGARVTAQLVFAGTPVSNPTVTISVLAQCRANGFGSAPCQVPFSPNQGPFSLDNSGNVPGGGITLQDNTLVQPASTQWLFTVSTNGIVPPAGTGPQSFSVPITISGASQNISATLSAAATSLSRLITTVPNFNVSSLTPGNCVQAAAGGQLVTIGGPCGSSAGFVTVTGSPSIGNLSCFSGATSITNCLLSGDVSTSGSGVTTLATVATPGTNTKITFDAKGRVTAGAQAQLASADYANQGTTTTVFHGNAAGNPSFAQVVSGDLNITPTSCVNQFVTGIAANGVGTCSPATLASAQFANQGTTTTLLHGNAAGNPSFGAVSLTADVSGTLPAAQMSQVNLAASGNGGVGGTLPGANMSQVNLAAGGNGGVNGNLPVTNLNGGAGASASTAWCGNGTWCTLSSVTEATWASSQPAAPGAGAAAKAYAETVLPSAHTLIRFTGFLGGNMTSCATTVPVVAFYDETGASALSSITLSNTGGQLYDSGAISVAMIAGHTFSMRITTAGDGACTAGNPATWTAVYK